MSLKVLGISASPRGKANSYYLLEKALGGVKQVIGDAVISLCTFQKKTFSGCLHCYGCLKTGTCVIQDDFQDLADPWWSAEAVIYSVPVYHMSIPGQLKCFIDRLGMSGFRKLVPEGGSVEGGKPWKCIGIISQGMHLCSGQEHAITELVNHALLMGCIPVAGNLWESYIGACGWTEGLRSQAALDELRGQGTLSAKTVVAAAESLGQNVAHLARIIQAGRTALSGQPRAENRKVERF